MRKQIRVNENPPRQKASLERLVKEFIASSQESSTQNRVSELYEWDLKCSLTGMPHCDTGRSVRVVLGIAGYEVYEISVLLTCKVFQFQLG